MAEGLRNVDEVFKDLEEYRDTLTTGEIVPSYKSRELVVYMSPDEFLELSVPIDDLDVRLFKEEFGGWTGRQHINNLTELVREGGVLRQVPSMSIEEGTSGRIRGHDGRHRAHALKQLGYEKMPVRIKHPTVRWDQQADSKLFDYERELPKRLVSQDGTKTMDVPWETEGPRRGLIKPDYDVPTLRGAAVADAPEKPGTPLRQARDKAADVALDRRNTHKWNSAVNSIQRLRRDSDLLEEALLSQGVSPADRTRVEGLLERARETRQRLFSDLQQIPMTQAEQAGQDFFKWMNLQPATEKGRVRIDHHANWHDIIRGRKPRILDTPIPGAPAWSDDPDFIRGMLKYVRAEQVMNKGLDELPPVQAPQIEAPWETSRDPRTERAFSREADDAEYARLRDEGDALEREIYEQKARGRDGRLPPDAKKRIQGARSKLLKLGKAFRKLGYLAGIAGTAYEANRLAQDIGQKGVGEGTLQYLGDVAGETGSLGTGIEAMTELESPEERMGLETSGMTKAMRMGGDVAGALGRGLKKGGRFISGEEEPFAAGEALAEGEGGLDDSAIGREIDREVDQAVADEEALQAGPRRGYNPQMVRESGWTDLRQRREDAARRALMSKKERKGKNL